MEETQDIAGEQLAVAYANRQAFFSNSILVQYPLSGLVGTTLTHRVLTTNDVFYSHIVKVMLDGSEIFIYLFVCFLLNGSGD